jgi:hypothetical protein
MAQIDGMADITLDGIITEVLILTILIEEQIMQVLTEGTTLINQLEVIEI